MASWIDPYLNDLSPRWADMDFFCDQILCIAEFMHNTNLYVLF